MRRLAARRAAGESPARLILLAFAIAVPAALSGTAAPPPTPTPRSPSAPSPDLLASGDSSHLWIVVRQEGHTKLLHIADSMAPGTLREAATLAVGPPIDLSSSGARVDLLFPARSALLPREHLLSASARQHPTSGRWYSVPADRLDLLPALPCESPIESLASAPEGPIILHEGDPHLWRLARGEWEPLDLPPEVASIPGRRLERGTNEISMLARTGIDQGWERWRRDGDDWRRSALGIPAKVDLRPIGGPNALAVEEGIPRRLVYLPNDGAIELATLDGNEVVAWFRQGPRLLSQDERLAIRAIDPVSGAFGPAEHPVLAFTNVFEWIHLPILGAAVVAILMIVFFVRSLRDPRESRIPAGWTPAPIPRRLLALAIDLAPAVVAVKLLLDAPWSAVLTPPALVLDTEAALPAFAVILIAVTLSALGEAIASRSLGKFLTGLRVVDARSETGAAPTVLQVLSRHIFKAVVLQLPALGLFTLIDPLRQGIGESVSATAVVRRASGGAGGAGATS